MSEALGRFPVMGTAAAVDAFRNATAQHSIGADADDGRLPLTFPIRWLALADVRTALLRLVPSADVVLVHESQSFDYSHPLHVDRPYTMTLTGRLTAAPDRLVVAGAIDDEAGIEQARLETILRLVAAPAGQTA